jgi:spore maturation protein CgeB
MSEQPRRREILYVAAMGAGNTSAYRFEALQRLGQDVTPFALEDWQPANRYLAALQFRYPAGPLILPVNRALRRTVSEQRPDVVWLDKPTAFTPGTIKAVQAMGSTVVCVNQDNPFGPREDGCWLQFMKAFRLFNVNCLFRDADVVRYAAWGLPYVKLLFSYEPSRHYPPPAGWSDADRDREVSYTGSPLEERPAFLARLGDQFRLPLSVAGPRWDQAWPPELRAKYVTGGMMKDGAYRESIWRSKINLAFLTHCNEDDIAHKAVEIAACGQFLLAERVPGHEALFVEDREAVFFGSVEECAEKSRWYLAHPEERERIAAAGRARAERFGYSNDAQLAKVLAYLDGTVAGAATAGGKV